MLRFKKKQLLSATYGNFLRGRPQNRENLTSFPIVRADTPYILKNPKFFYTKKCERPHLSSPLSERCPHLTNPLSPDCGRLLWTAP